MSVFNSLESLDQQLLIAINHAHSKVGDIVFWYASKTITFIPLILLAIVYLRAKIGLKNTFYVLLACACLLAFIDTTTTYLFKEQIQRFRPSHHTSIGPKLYLHALEDGTFYIGGQFGFFSSHAGNNMGIAVFLGLILRRFSKLPLIIGLACALVIGYSRSYLGVHYPSDVLCGFLWGALCGYVGYRFLKSRSSFHTNTF
jgi:undecaprenyl-diphosphatase